jgi:hypothetical protein
MPQGASASGGSITNNIRVKISQINTMAGIHPEPALQAFSHQVM